MHGSIVMLRRVNRMRPSLKNALRLALFLGVSLCVSAQAGLTQALQPSSSPSTSSTANDPLGRNTPSNAVLGFLKAAQDGNLSIAAQYLQMSPAHRQAEGEQTAAKLKFVLDHVFSGNLSRYNQAEGTPQEGVRRDIKSWERCLPGMWKSISM